MSSSFVQVGTVISQIPVRISYRIIELFSEGLYASPTKAVEELVANSFDAGARNVHVLLSPDRAASDAVIIVVDDGDSMDEEGLKQHWLIGVSNKRSLFALPKGRKQIGKFGIGKLATFVLASNLTHICKKDGRYFAATMDYRTIPEKKGVGAELNADEGVDLPLRELTEEQAREAIPKLLVGNKPGHKALALFGAKAPKSWTIAVLSDLKDMARELKKGRLSWVLRTAMPLRPDFHLYLDGEEQKPSKAEVEPLKRWVLGDDLDKVPTPAPDDLEVSEDTAASPEFRYGLTHPQLGRITGYAEVFEEPLTEGKSAQLDRSHGFFVYIHGRLINTDDPHFGLPANSLRHGTFARFRMVVHIDRLDDELRSTRETVRDATLSAIARNILHGVFNVARVWLESHQETQKPGQRVTTRIRQSPGSLSRRPVIDLVESALRGDVSPRFINYPKSLSAGQATEFTQHLTARAFSDEGLVKAVKTQELSSTQGIAILDVETGTLTRNMLHPFVAAYSEGNGEEDVLSFMCMAEVLTEAYLYGLELSDEQVRDVMDRRDDLLRSFAKTALRKTAAMIAQELEDAASDQHLLETMVVEAFSSLGYHAIHVGGSGEPDGLATANLAPLAGQKRQYKVSLEAKSKVDPSASVSAKHVGISAVARQRDDHNCTHAIVVGPDFAVGKGDDAAVIKEALDDKHKNAALGKTITLMRVHDLARLVRLAALKPVGLDTLAGLFRDCIAPDEASQWVTELSERQVPSKPPYEKILSVIWNRQSERPDEAVDFGSLMTALDLMEGIKLAKDQLVDLCKALQRVAPESVSIREQTVEITLPPDRVMEIARKNLMQFSEGEQKTSAFNL